MSSGKAASTCTEGREFEEREQRRPATEKAVRPPESRPSPCSSINNVAECGARIFSRLEIWCGVASGNETRTTAGRGIDY